LPQVLWQIEPGRRTVVGLNKLQTEELLPEGRFRVNLAAAERQIERLKQVRARLEEVAASDQNTMPIFIECVENYLTLGEICGALRKVFGERLSSGTSSTPPRLGGTARRRECPRRIARQVVRGR
jgi:methylmalonyl-CoA mutase N-terminal domain/subunit